MPQPSMEEVHGHTGLRGVAALCVFVYHLHWEVWFPGWFGYAVSRLVSWPGLAVDIFFILSGFILCHVYVFRRMSSLVSYLVARFARIFPLSVTVVLFCMALDGYSYWLHGIYSPNLDCVRILVNLLNVQAWDGDAIENSINPPSWSISVECFLYIFVFPPLFYWFGGGGLSSRKRVAICLAGAWAGAIFVSQASIEHQALVRGATGFASGFFIRQLTPYVGIGSRGVNWLGASSAALLSIAFITNCRLNGLELVLAAGVVFTSAYNTSWLGLVFGVAPLRWLGERSYSIYLIHHPLIVFFFRLVLYPRQSVEGYPMSVVILTHTLIFICTLVGADISYRLFEMPVRNLLRNWLSLRLLKRNNSVVNSIS